MTSVWRARSSASWALRMALAVPSSSQRLATSSGSGAGIQAVVRTASAITIALPGGQVR